MHTEIISVPARFAGPPGYANGGWIAGMIAQATDLNPAQITLRSPVPLETDLILTADRLMVGETLIAEIAQGTFTRDVPPFVFVTEAIAAESRSHVRSTADYGHCVVCGADRTDGYQLRPGPVAGSATLVACRWSPRLISPPLPDTARIPAIWAAMDCPGVWTVDAALEPMLLGRMTGEITGDFESSADDFIVVGEFNSREGRKMLTSTAVYRTDGTLVAHAEQVWISITV
jgi:hypothetical protein